jgi:hypothetical protein
MSGIDETNSSACRCLWPCLVMSGTKCHRFLMTQLWRCLPSIGNPQAWLLGARGCLEPGGQGELGWQVVKCCPPLATEIEKVLVQITPGFSSF